MAHSIKLHFRKAGWHKFDFVIRSYQITQGTHLLYLISKPHCAAFIKYDNKTHIHFSGLWKGDLMSNLEEGNQALHTP